LSPVLGFSVKPVTDWGKMLQALWHNVPMAAGAAAAAAGAAAHAAASASKAGAEPHAAEARARRFQPDWREVERGLPIATLEEFSAYSGFPLKDLLEVAIPPRTLKHRRQRNEPLSMDESDRLVRVARLYELGVKVFGNPDKARRWLSKPKDRFDGRSPLSMMRTGLGGKAVEEMLYQIDEGMFA
jgi:putative toxin-antitoxin system antitoxin component (TIGR02293 family)